MSIWGRLSAATRELSLGGQISSLFGFEPESEPPPPEAECDNEVPFTVGVIVLSAKMAKADGTVATYEIKAFKEAFKVSAAEMKQVAPVFNSAKRDAANFEAQAERLVTVFGGNRKLLEDVLDGLFHIAKADDEIGPQEEEFLAEVAKRFGFSTSEFELDQSSPHLRRQAQSLRRAWPEAFRQRRGAGASLPQASRGR